MAKFETTHTLAGQRVRAICWKKDGDHPLVERYPVERREWKGLLTVSAKEKYALHFGDWIIEDEKGRIWVETPETFARKIAGASAGPVAGIAPVIAAAVIAVLGFFFGDASQLPLVIGFGVTHLMYYSALLGQWNGLANAVFDLDTDTIKVSAHTNTYTPNQDTHDFFDDATNEVTGTNYIAGGATLGSVTLTRSTNTVTFDAADVVWTQSGAGFSTARKFVIYRSTGAGATSRLFSVVTADADVGNVTGDLTIAWNSSGIATWSTT